MLAGTQVEKEKEIIDEFAHNRTKEEEKRSVWLTETLKKIYKNKKTL